MSEQSSPSSSAQVVPASRPGSFLRQPALWVALIALGLVLWQALDARSRLTALHLEVSRRLAAADASANDARLAVRQNLEALAALQAKTADLETRLAESQSQQATLDAMVQELTRNREERLLAEVEQSLDIAAQQLQIAGNVEAALVALQGADARLAAAGRTHFLPLRKALARDIERLKALPLADVAGIALRLESVIAGIDSLPLAFEARPRAEVPSAAFVPTPPAAGWRANAEKLWSELWGELKSLIRVDRLDRPDPALLSPTHAFFLRENLKLRLVNARLSLLQRDGQSFRQDVTQAQDWLKKYFDTRSRAVQSARATLRQLDETDVSLALPGLQESLTTLRNLKIQRDREASPAPVRTQDGAGR